MKRLTYIFTSMLILSVLFITCEKEGGTNYYPHKDQSFWIYHDTVSQTLWTSKFNGTKIHSVVGEVQVLEINFQGQNTEEYVKVTENDVTYYGDLINENYKYVLLQFPIEVGKTWNWIWEYQNETSNMSAKIDKEEKITVPVGEFTCYKVIYYSDGVIVDIVWFANNTGVVRDLEEGYHDLQLITFNEPS